MHVQLSTAEKRCGDMSELLCQSTDYCSALITVSLLVPKGPQVPLRNEVDRREADSQMR